MDPANVLHTTLLLLYFVTPAANGPKDETKRIWTLQSTSTIETPNATACVTLGKKMIKDIVPVANLTVRAYCLCAQGDGSQCGEPSTVPSAAEAAPVERRPTVQRLGPDTAIPAQKK